MAEATQSLAEARPQEMFPILDPAEIERLRRFGRYRPRRGPQRVRRRMPRSRPSRVSGNMRSSMIRRIIWIEGALSQ